MPRLSITLLGLRAHELHRLVDVAQVAAAAGIDDVQVSEHVLMQVRAYGRFFHELDEPMPAPLVTLAIACFREPGVA